MSGSRMHFDDNQSAKIQIPEQDGFVSLTISDALDAYGEEIEAQYEERILRFINSSGIWYRACADKLRKDPGSGSNYRLVEIFVLSEQDSKEITFGLLFNVSGDREPIHRT